MKSGSGVGRAVYTVVYLLIVGATAYSLRDYMTDSIPKWARVNFGMFYQIAQILGYGAILALLYYFYEAIANTYTAVAMRLGGGVEVNYEGETYGRNLARSAHRLERKRDFLGAADAYEALEMWPEAARCLESASAYSRAAAAWKRCGQNDKAMSLYERAGEFEAAGELAAAEGLRDRATRNFRQAAERASENNNFARSAEMYERAYDFDKAAGIYERLKRDFDAVRCYEQAGSTAKIEVILADGEPNRLWPANDERRVEVAGRVAALYLREGRAAKAAEVFASAGQLMQAAEAYEKAGDWVRAAESYLSVDEDAKAEAAIARHSDETSAAEFRARLAVKRGDYAVAGEQYVLAGSPMQAIEYFKRSKRYVDAGTVYESLGRPLMAADMFSTAKEYVRAAAAYEAARDWRSAAECYEAVNDLDGALRCHSAAGDFYKAGIAARGLGDHRRAIEFFQRVSPDSPTHSFAQGFLGVSLLETGRQSAAADLLDGIQAQIPRTLEFLPVLYAYGLLMENAAPEKSLAAYRSILTVDYQYKDVDERIPRLEAAQEEARARAEAEAAARDSGNGSHPQPTGSAFPATRVVSGFKTGAATDPAGYSTANIATSAGTTKFGTGGRYTIMQELGRGGMAIVYKAFDEHLQREVALKTFPLPLHGTSTREETFLREARLVARLSHPNVVTLFDCGRMDNLYYIAMEYVPGENLKQSVKRKGPMTLEDIRSVMRQLCDALMYAHSQSVLHLDIKPGNIIMRQSGDLKVVDFGLAKILSETVARGGTNEDSQPTLVGTPQYMAPEQILGSEVDERTDIYALGLTFFYLLTGRTPFDVKKVSDPVEISRLQVNTTFPRPSTLRATLPPKVDEVFVRCTHKNPSDRYGQVKDLLADFMGV